MVWGEGDDQQFAMFELTPSFSKRGAVEVKWFQAYPLRQGVGSRAMKELQTLAREDGITLTLFPWDKGQVSQAKLTKFYKGQGFTPTVKGGKAMTWAPEIDEAEVGTINAKTIANQLKAAGYSNVGTGADSTVWAKDENYIIKILMPEDLGTKAEQVFRKFYEFAMSHQDLACMPRFNEVNTVDINGKDYTQIEMERLAPIEKGTFMEGVVWFFSDFCEAQESWDKVDHAMGLSDTWEWYPYTKRSKSIANVFVRQWQDLMYNEKSYAMYKQLYNTMSVLYNTGKINKFGWDLHTENVIQRSNGQPVIIDPWFSAGT
jgi:hypothetical protein